MLALFVLLAMTVLYCVRPWRAYFYTGLADHWDPRLMGEWMAWNAHHILQGHIFRPDYNANFFYPHAYTLAFSELLWPQSFIYAAVYAFSGNLFLSFNATMLFFWALSGLTLYALLRELQLTRGVSYLGSFIFCLIPYRMAYYVEFNMVLVFIIPLMLLLLIRWLRRPGIGNALGFIVGYWFCATSCLYFTIMAAIMLAFVFVISVANDRSLLHRKDFFITLGIIFCGVAAITAIYLYPYMLLRIHGGYTRTAVDYLKHHAQAMHYLDTRCAALIYPIFATPRVRITETYLFPGTVLGILSVVFFITNIMRFVQQLHVTNPIKILLAGSKFILWMIFWTTIIIHAFFGRVAWLALFDQWLYVVCFALIMLYGLDILLPRRDGQNAIIRSGMAAAAVFCFFISLGPLITVGPDAGRLSVSRGPFADISAWVPLFEAVRGLTRFSIVILIYLLVAGCSTLDRLVRKNNRLIWVFPILVLLLIYEASMMRYKFTDYSHVVRSKIVQKIQHLPAESVLFQLPGAVRAIDATIVMDTIGNFPLLINGYSGFAPEEYNNIYLWERTGWRLDKITKRLSRIWPPVYLVLDKQEKNRLSEGWHKPFPQKLIERDWNLLDQDALYELYTLKQTKITSTSIIRRIRTDVLKKHPVLCFSAHLLRCGSCQRSAQILLNGKKIDSQPITPRWRPYRVPLPPVAMGRLVGDEVTLELMKATDTTLTDRSSGPEWEVKGINFVSAQ